MSPWLELRPKLAVVVELPIEDEGYRLILVVGRLLALFEIDDA